MLPDLFDLPKSVKQNQAELSVTNSPRAKGVTGEVTAQVFSLRFGMGIEPITNGLIARCSTNELTNGRSGLYPKPFAERS